ncbi:glycosyltransferase [Clostridium perfringens]
MKIKVFHIIPDLGVGGAEKLVLDLCRNIDKNKFDVKVISLFARTNSIYDEQAEKDGIDIIYLDKKKGLDLSILYKLISLFKKYKPDIINTHLYVMSYVLPAAIFTRRKNIVHTVHNIAEKELRDSVKKIMKIAYRYFNVKPIAISNMIMESIESEYKISKKNIKCIYNGIDTTVFSGEKAKINNSINLISVGRFTEQKNHKMMIEAFSKALKKNNNLKLILVGDGILRREIENIVRKKGIYSKVEFRGVKSNICNELKRAHIYISSSLWEGLPITILEAMSCGLPILCTDVGGNKDVVKENGILVENNNCEQLTNAILMLADDLEKINNMGLLSTKLSKAYDIRNTAKEYENLYNSL